MSKQILDHFQRVDPVLHQAAIKYEIDLGEPYPAEQYFERLCRAIVGQQLSVKAAATIWSRFEALVQNQSRDMPQAQHDPGIFLSPELVNKVKHDDMRGVGLSNAKARYVLGMAEMIIKKEIVLDRLAELEDDEIIGELTKIKGIGKWSAEMFLMFTLGRTDLFSVGDLGLRRAMERLYELDNPSEEELITLASKWSPYRTYACRVLWETLDNQPNK